MHDDEIDKEIILPKRKNKGKCKPSPLPKKRFDHDNDSWVGIREKKKLLPIYEETLNLLIKENLLSLDDPTLVTWSPSYYCKLLDPPKKY